MILSVYHTDTAHLIYRDPFATFMSLVNLLSVRASLRAHIYTVFIWFIWDVSTLDRIQYTTGYIWLTVILTFWIALTLLVLHVFRRCCCVIPEIAAVRKAPSTLRPLYVHYTIFDPQLADSMQEMQGAWIQYLSTFNFLCHMFNVCSFLQNLKHTTANCAMPANQDWQHMFYSPVGPQQRQMTGNEKE